MYVAEQELAHTLTLIGAVSMNIYSIYKVVNQINGKVYIGFTKDYKQRIRQHKKSITNPKYKSKFHNALRKYGWDNFVWDIIFQSKDENYCKSIMEPHFIVEHNSRERGYNITMGGEGALGLKHDKDIRYKIGSRTRGKTLPKEHKLKISKSHIGIKHSKETREYMSRNRKGRNWYNNGIKNTQSHTHPGEGWIRGRV